VDRGDEGQLTSGGKNKATCKQRLL
jgi:hypothetical protein